MTNKDLYISDSILQTEVKKFNAIGQLRRDSLESNFPKYHFDQKQFSIDLEDFKRQYVIAITPSGDRLIHINLFCESVEHEYWNKEYVNVYGGGNCFFQTTVNITKKESIEFTINPII